MVTSWRCKGWRVCLCPLVACLILLLNLWSSKNVSRNTLGSVTTTATTKTAISLPPLARTKVTRLGRFFLCKTLIGRLGNHMFQYASLYGIARSKGMVPVIDANDKINDVFNVWALKLRRRNGSVCQGMAAHREVRASAYDEASVRFPDDRNTQLNGYLQSFIYFKEYEDDIRRQFRFSDHVTETAKHVLQGYLTDLPSASTHGVNATLVAIHFRRGDKLRASDIALGMTIATVDYVIKAQKYFMTKYGHVIFVVCSDSIDWCLENFSRNNTVFIENQSPTVDLAIMSQCDHVIMSVGTFGWWAGWLANGETVYYGRRFVPGSPLSRQWNISHHYPAHWIQME